MSDHLQAYATCYFCDSNYGLKQVTIERSASRHIVVYACTVCEEIMKGE